MKHEIEERLTKIDALLDQAQKRLDTAERIAHQDVAKQKDLEGRLMRQRKQFVTLEHRVKDADRLIDKNKQLHEQQNQAKESFRRILDLAKNLGGEFLE